MSTHDFPPHDDEPKIIDPSISLEEFKIVLNAAGIPLEEFGRDGAKTVEDLLKELQSGDSYITIQPNSELRRYVSLVWVDVICELPNGDVAILREDRQVFKDGRDGVNEKRRSLPSSLGEKMKPDEDRDATAMRALSEEIGVENVVSLHKIGEDVRTFIPDTYPGVVSTYSSFSYVAVIPTSSYVPEGYVEHQKQKDNYYTWDTLSKITN